MAEREVGRDRRREGASGAVRIRRPDARGAQLGEGVAVEQQIDDLVALGVSARNDDGRCAHLADPIGGRPRVFNRFDAVAAQVGAKVEFQYWTFGEYDGALVLTAPDDTSIGALAVGLGRLGNVRTTMLRAFDIGEFRKILEKMPKF